MNLIYRTIVYYFLAVYLKGLLQSLKLYSGHPPDLVKCTTDFNVSTLFLFNYINSKRILIVNIIRVTFNDKYVKTEEIFLMINVYIFCVRSDLRTGSK